MKDEGMGARESQVAERLMWLNESCDELHKEIEILETKLESVLRAPEPGTGKCEEEKPPVLVALAQQLSERVESVRHASRRISGIRQRLEL